MADPISKEMLHDAGIIKSRFIKDYEKCCTRIRLDYKDNFENFIMVCSTQSVENKCLLEIKYLKEVLTSNCLTKFYVRLNDVFDNGNLNVKEFLFSFTNLSTDYVYSRTYDFIKNKIEMIKHLEPVSKKIAEEKLVTLIQELGTEFVKFVKMNSVTSQDLISGTHIIDDYPEVKYIFILLGRCFNDGTNTCHFTDRNSRCNISSTNSRTCGS